MSDSLEDYLKDVYDTPEVKSSFYGECCLRRIWRYFAEFIEVMTKKKLPEVTLNYPKDTKEAMESARCCERLKEHVESLRRRIIWKSNASWEFNVTRDYMVELVELLG